jgi:dihydroorotase
MTEMSALLAAGAVAFSDDGKTIMDSGVMRRVLEYSTLVGAPVMTHAEDRTLVAGGVGERGARVDAARAAREPRDRRGGAHLARPRARARHGAHLHVAHVVDARRDRADPARARARHPRHVGGRAAPP